MDNKPFAMFFNASPRKGWNTHKMLEAAKAGAEEAGAVTELVNLYDIKFPGCKSCFACKLKNAKTGGVCAIRDDLRPILERARKAHTPFVLAFLSLQAKQLLQPANGKS